MYSPLMKKNFDARAASYDQFAEVQKWMADQLTGILQRRAVRAQRIFDVGCGTGYFSACLQRAFVPDYLLLNDISRNMLDLCRQKMDETDCKVHFLEADFESYTFTEKFDLIASNAVFQWFKSLRQPLNRIRSGLCPGGTLAFSTLVQGTFHEMVTAFVHAYGERGQEHVDHTLQFQSEHEIAAELQQEGFQIDYCESATRVVYFQHPLQFLKGVKLIGASGFKGERVDYGILKGMLAQYEKLFATGEGLIPATYRIATYVARQQSHGKPFFLKEKEGRLDLVNGRNKPVGSEAYLAPV